MPSNDEILGSVISESCISLFQDYALPLKRAEGVAFEGDIEFLYCGALGFTGDQMRGTMVLATSREPLGRTLPFPDGSHREWIAELANQLLGRIKNKLSLRGVTMHVSTPIVLRGEYLASVPRCAELGAQAFTCDNGFVCVWFDSEQASDLDLSQISNVEVLEEGETMLF